MLEYVYLPSNVLEEAQKRVSFLFDEFEKVVCSFSGGKDFNIVLLIIFSKVIKRNRFPLDVFFVDQEAEWSYTIELADKHKNNPELNFHWFQIELDYTNNSSSLEVMIRVWDERKKEFWIREKRKDAITENTFGITRFGEFFEKILPIFFPDQKTCFFAGVRTEESPARKMGLTSAITYKWITWGKRLTSGRDNYFTFYPIYDWTYRDIWKYIFDNKVPYSKLYDLQYSLGLNIPEMRTSSLIHETALKSLTHMREIDKDMAGKLIKRFDGINTYIQSTKSYSVENLPFMFENWKDYREYLIDHLIIVEKDRKTIRQHIKEVEKLMDKYDMNYKEREPFEKTIIKGVLISDLDGTKFKNVNSKLRTSQYEKRYTKSLQNN